LKTGTETEHPVKALAAGLPLSFWIRTMFKVFPCNGKIPLINGWREKATSDPEQIRLWQELFRDRLTHWGIPTGAINGIYVLDVDVKGDGFRTLNEFQLPIPNTMCQQTISGGAHYVFKYPSDGKVHGSRVKFMPGLDTRGEGGYIIHYGLNQTPLAEAPEWLLKVNKYQPLTTGEPIRVAPEIAGDIIMRAVETLREAPEGERNHTLNRQAFVVARLVVAQSVSYQYAYDILYNAAISIGLTPHESKATIESAFKGAQQKPLTVPFTEPKPEYYMPPPPIPERWTPSHFTLFDINNRANLKRPQLFKDWSTKDIHITTADGGTGKTTLKIYEAICLALGIPFLGFQCLEPGRTLYITGEDTSAKLAAMIGQMLRQMGIIDDLQKVNTVLDNIIVKKDSDLCLIAKDRQGFLHPNESAMDNVLQATYDLKPKMIVFDPISSFWGSEAALNDMAKAVSRFMQKLTYESQACVEMINHMGKVSSQTKDMGQFAGRGGTGLPSHARVSRVLRYVNEEELSELTSVPLEEGESAILCNVNKFSDGSPLLNKPFLIIRKGFLFRRVELSGKVERQAEILQTDAQRVLNYVRELRTNGAWPTKNIIISHFMNTPDKLSKDRTSRALDVLQYLGEDGYKLQAVPNPLDGASKDKVFTIMDPSGNELR
jgi:hypothetical protein